MSTAKKIYTAIDVHGKAEAWPSVIPKMTDDEATRAARRLWRFSLGTTFTGAVKITTGNRRNRIGWERDGNMRTIFVNPSHGWKDFVHDLSHWFDILANGESKHGAHHARFEAKLVREVIRRGYLEGKLATPEPEAPVALAPEAAKVVQQRKKLDALMTRAARWEAKRKRAERALAKIKKSARYYEKAVALADAR